MTKRLLVYIFSLTLMLWAPLHINAMEAEAQPAELTAEEEIGIAVSQQSLHITGAQGQTLEVVSLTGRRVLTVKIESPAQRVDLNVPKGCYILKIGKVVRKVSIV